MSMDILWTGLWTNYGLPCGLDGLYYGLSMDYTVDCLGTGIGIPWTILGTYSRDCQRDYLGTW